jgi:hypothetical protein
MARYAVNGKEKTTYSFDQRTVRVNSNLDRIRDFLTEHFRPEMGADWKREVRDLPTQEPEQGQILPAGNRLGPASGATPQQQRQSMQGTMQEPMREPMLLNAQETPLYVPSSQSRPEF